VHEALDQFGALFGPLLVALVLAVTRHDYKVAFATLAVPAAIMLSLLAVARLLYPRPQDLAAGSAPPAGGGPSPTACSPASTAPAGWSQHRDRPAGQRLARRPGRVLHGRGARRDPPDPDGPGAHPVGQLPARFAAEEKRWMS
jgi:hypothetical protein